MIVGGEMPSNDTGRMIGKTWNETPQPCPGVELDVIQFMLNHLHGAIVVCDVGTDLCVCPNPMLGSGRAQGPPLQGCRALLDNSRH